MACQDDIFDIEALVKKHGNKSDKKAWKDHMDLFNQFEAESALYRKLRGSIARVVRIIDGKESPFEG